MTDSKTFDLSTSIFKALDAFNASLRSSSTNVENSKAVEEVITNMQLHVDSIVRGLVVKQARDSMPVEKSLQSPIYTDGAFFPDTGEYAWGTVTDDLGNDLLAGHLQLLKDMDIKKVNTPKGERHVIMAKFTDVKKNQNNGAELLALVAGLRIALANPRVTVVSSDSDLLVKWWSVGHIKPTTAAKMDPTKKQYINELTSLRANFESSGPKGQKRLLHIPGDKNPADLGFHKKA